MRTRILNSLFAAWSLLTIAAAQSAAPAEPAFIPAGTKIILSLKQAISTRNARDGDPVYAETIFPVIAGDRVAVPARTLVQGIVVKARRAGRMRGRPAIGLRFTSMIRDDGTVVPLAGQLSNTPGGERLSVDQAQSSIVGDRQTRAQVDGEIHAVTTGAFRGTFFGLLFGGTVTAMRAGAGVGMAAGLVWAIAGRQENMRLRQGTQIQITLQSAMPLTLASGQQVPPSSPTTSPSEIPTALIAIDDENRSQP